MNKKLAICMACFEPLKKGPVIEYYVPDLPGSHVPRHRQTYVHRTDSDHAEEVTFVKCETQEDRCRCCGDPTGERVRYLVTGIWRKDGARKLYCLVCTQHPRERKCDPYDSPTSRREAIRVQNARPKSAAASERMRNLMAGLEL